jgi:pimeloyl-ACP methyl ester carboxylesterase
MLVRVKQVVRFAATPAGRVAYSVTGSGPPLVCMLGWVSHLGLMWEDPGTAGSSRRWRGSTPSSDTTRSAAACPIGPGQSSLWSRAAVLEALAEHLELKRFALFGSCESGQVAVAYAARHPDVLSSLIVYGSCARGTDLVPDEVKLSILSLVRAHWGLGSRVLADIWFPDAPAELTALFARMQREAATADVAASLLDMFYRLDVADLLSTIQVPTLVAHRRGSRAVRFELGRELAALIPGAQLAALDGRMQPIYAEGADAAASTLLAFLRGQAVRGDRGPAAAHSRRGSFRSPI